jgi:Tol biopolymer transport system component
MSGCRRCLSVLVFSLALTLAAGIPPARAYNPERVTPSTADESCPVLDWEGVNLYYESNVSGHYHIYRRPVEGGEETQVTFSDTDDRYPALSWGGDQLVFSRLATPTSWFLYVVSLDSGVEQQVSVSFNDGDADLYPAWSADDAKIYYIRRSGSTGDTELMVVPVTGGSGTVFLALSGTQTGPRVSHDGARLLFGSDHVGGVSNFFEYRLRKPIGLTQLTSFTDASMGVVPYDYSPDDAAILYTAKLSTGQADLFQFDYATRVSTRITYDGCGGACDPATAFGTWSPDGAWIYFSSCRSIGDRNIWRVTGLQTPPTMILTGLTPSVGRLTPGSTYTLRFRLCNFEAGARTASWCYSDRLGWKTPQCQSVSVPASGTATFSLSGTVPAAACPCDTNQFTVTASVPGAVLTGEAQVTLKAAGVDLGPGGAIERAPDSGHLHTDPCWTPDGQYLVYICADASLGWRVARTPVAGGAEQLLSDPTGFYLPGERYPSVSPDGTRIVFRRYSGISGIPVHPVVTGLYVIPMTGGLGTMLTDTGESASDAAPEWSADGQTIYFQRTNNSTGKIFLMSTPSGGSNQEHVFLTLPGSQVQPKVSPDGLRLAFGSTHLDGNHYNIFECLLSDPTTLRQITFEATSTWPEDYSPDGGRLLCMTEKYNGRPELAEIDLQTMEEQRLTSDADAAAMWYLYGSYAPDGIRVAFSSARPSGDLPHVWILHRDVNGIPVCGKCPTSLAEPMPPAAHRDIPFSFCNCGPVTGRYAWRLSDDEGWMPVQVDTVEIPAGRSLEVVASITAPPAFTTPSDSNFVRFHVAVVGNVPEVKNCVAIISLDKEPIEVLLTRFEAVSEPRGIRLSWEPAGERNLLFQVWRREAAGDSWSRRTDTPIAVTRRGEFLDEDVAPGSRYRYRLEALDRTGARDWTGEIEALFLPPAGALSFAAVSPSLFRARLQLELVLPTESRASIRVFDISGRVVRSLLDGQQFAAGTWPFVWDARDDGGNPVGGGVFFVRAVVVNGAGRVETRVVRAVRLR